MSNDFLGLRGHRWVTDAAEPLIGRLIFTNHPLVEAAAATVASAQLLVLVADIGWTVLTASDLVTA